MLLLEERDTMQLISVTEHWTRCCHCLLDKWMRLPSASAVSRLYALVPPLRFFLEKKPAPLSVFLKTSEGDKWHTPDNSTRFYIQRGQFRRCGQGIGKLQGIMQEAGMGPSQAVTTQFLCLKKSTNLLSRDRARLIRPSELGTRGIETLTSLSSLPLAPAKTP